MKNKNNFSTKTIAYSSICIAIAFALSLISIFKMPQGGSVHFCNMIFLSIIGYWFGIKVGIISCITYGIINFITFPYYYHIMQVILDYILGFGALGISGLFCNKKYGLYIGYILGSFLRLIFSTISGVVFFKDYCHNNSYLSYSIIYNLSYILPEVIITFVVIILPPIKNIIDKLNPNIKINNI